MESGEHNMPGISELYRLDEEAKERIDLGYFDDPSKSYCLDPVPHVIQGDLVILDNDSERNLDYPIYYVSIGKVYKVAKTANEGLLEYVIEIFNDNGVLETFYEDRFIKVISKDPQGAAHEPIVSYDSIGAKFDTGKLLFSLLFKGLALPLRCIAAVLTYGAQKYAADSWQQVPNGKQRYEDALYRHQNARAIGEVYDAESGLPHRAHEACNQLFLLWFDIQDGTIKNLENFNPTIPNIDKQ